MPINRAESPYSKVRRETLRRVDPTGVTPFATESDSIPGSAHSEGPAVYWDITVFDGTSVAFYIQAEHTVVGSADVVHPGSFFTENDVEGWS